MPYFRWSGVDIMGKDRCGKRFATSLSDLDQILFKRDIALLRCTLARVWWSGKVKSSAKLVMLKQLATLINSGVLLPDALELVSEQIGHLPLQETMFTIAEDVRHGVAFSKACAQYPHVFDHMTIHMMQVGYDAGNVAQVLEQICAYQEQAHAFRNKLRAAAWLPLLTLGFFVIIALTIFIVIVPKFAQLFQSAHQELPYLTQVVMSISDALRSWYALAGVLTLAVVGIGVRRYSKSKNGKPIIDALVLRVPVLKDSISNSAMVYFLRSMALLLQGGMQLLPALRTAKNVVGNSVLHNHLSKLEYDIESGCSLSQAFMHYDERLFTQELVALTKVGEESGNIGYMLGHAATVYDEKVKRSLLMIATMLQPILMIVLGLLIGLLVFAVYGPIFNMANIAY